MQMGLGPLHAVSLAQARELARQARALRSQGCNPLALKRTATVSQRSS